MADFCTAPLAGICSAVDNNLERMRRIVMRAPQESRIDAFARESREMIRWAKFGVEQSDVIDDMRAIGLETGLGEDSIQTLLAEAVRNPFDPSPPATSKAADRPTPTKSSELVMTCASDIRPEAIRWLWPGRIALGKQTIIAGEPGLGKSQLTCWITATVTTCGYWPGNEAMASPGSAIILSAEDDAADTIVPRLQAAGADLSRVHILSAVMAEDGNGRRAFNLQRDLHALEKQIERIGDVRLVVIDPVSSYLGKVDSHRNAELRAVLEPVGEMAARLGVAVLSVTHLSKGGGASANSRFIGSIAFVAAARAAFIVARDPDDNERRLFLPTKNNLGPEGAGLGFRIGQVAAPSGLIAPAVFWDAKPVTMSANEALGASDQSGSAPARDEAEDFLRDQLADGPISAKAIKAEAGDAGLAWKTVLRAKAALGVKSSKTGVGAGWQWALPQDGQG